MSPWHNKFNSLDGNAKLKNSMGSHRPYKGTPHSALKYNCLWNKTPVIYFAGSPFTRDFSQGNESHF